MNKGDMWLMDGKLFLCGSWNRPICLTTGVVGGQMGDYVQVPIVDGDSVRRAFNRVSLEATERPERTLTELPPGCVFRRGYTYIKLEPFEFTGLTYEYCDLEGTFYFYSEEDAAPTTLYSNWRLVIGFEAPLLETPRESAAGRVEGTTTVGAFQLGGRTRRPPRPS